jgi:hypothetical protein
MKIRGCRLCALGDCMCDRVTRWNDIRGIITPDDFKEGYRRKYLINIHRVDPDDVTNADRYIEIFQNWNLPARLEDGTPNPSRRYGGDDGYRRFKNDLEALTPRPVRW